MKTIGIIANCSKKRAADVLRKLEAKALALKLTLLADAATAKLLKSAERVSFAEMFERVDAVMALGGDGTVLRTVRELDGKDNPVMGVNIGGLGFLTSLAEEELDEALECLASDNIVLSRRTVMACTVERDGVEVGRYRGLNEVLVSSGPSSRIATLAVCIDNTKVTSYMCDGLVISTPTGSTGHSLSAGGPILTPESAAFVVSLICPHTLSSRPLVVPDESTIAVTAVASGGGLFVSVDGQVGQPLEPGDCVTAARSDCAAHLIHLPTHDYFAVLRQKLKWGGSAV